jgi:hypothetical protein
MPQQLANSRPAAAPHLLAGALVALALAACDDGKPTPDAAEAARAEERVDPRSFQAWWERHVDAADRGDGSPEAIEAGHWDALPHGRIALKVRDTGYTWGALELAFERGGRATRRGGLLGWPEDWRGEASGELDFHDYAELCWLIDRLELPRRSEEWTCLAFHGQTVELSWSEPDGETVVLSEYASSGPPELAALRAAIESAALRVDWEPAAEVEAR